MQRPTDTRAAEAVDSHFATTGADQHSTSPAPVAGVGVGGGRCEGRARVWCKGFDLERVGPGEVLVVPAPLPEYAVVLPVIGALVSERGGSLCALATLAREAGRPLVVAAQSATGRIPDGAVVLVDGDRGVVELRRY